MASSAFSRAFAAGRGAASKSSASKGRGRGDSSQAKVGDKVAKTATEEEDEAEGTVTCANRGLLQKMLSTVSDEEAEEEDMGNDGQLGMSLRNVTARPQPSGRVPTITSPPSHGPVSRGAVRRMSLESQGRPDSRDGEQRSAPSSTRAKVTTGAPRPSITTYVSQPRPGSRGGTMPPGEVMSTPGRQSQKPVVRPAVQPKSKSGGGHGRAAGYAGLHQARVKPTSPSAQPAVKPRCGPSAFDLVKKLTDQGDASVEGEETPEMDEESFIMPPGSDEDAEHEEQVVNLEKNRSTAAAEDSAADYVAQVKRDLGLEEGAAGLVKQMPDPGPHSAHPRARSSDTRTDAVAAMAPAGSLPRSRSSDPRAHVAAARAYKSQDSDEEDDDDEVDQRRSFQWKADVRSLVKNFAEEERTRAASPKSKPASSPATRQPVDARKPPRAPISGAERQAAPQVEKEEETSSSKKPRVPIDYTPATLEEYKQRFGNKADYSELGRLGPDLDDENLLMKRAIQEKVKQFSRELHRVNKHRAGKAQPKPEAKAEPKSTARAKAMQFAKNVPKPKLVPPKQVLVTPSKTADDDQDAIEWEELRRREQQHMEDVARVAEVRQLLEKLAGEPRALDDWKSPCPCAYHCISIP